MGCKMTAIINLVGTETNFEGLRPSVYAQIAKNRFRSNLIASTGNCNLASVPRRHLSMGCKMAAIINLVGTEANFEALRPSVFVKITKNRNNHEHRKL